jgi:hypothetical protein
MAVLRITLHHGNPFRAGFQARILNDQTHFVQFESSAFIVYKTDRIPKPRPASYLICSTLLPTSLIPHPTTGSSEIASDHP